jgi:hypothetical protein
MEGMASKRTTVVLTDAEQQALRRASKAEGLSQSQLIRKGIRSVTSAYQKRVKPLTGWLKLSGEEWAEILADKPRFDRE